MQKILFSKWTLAFMSALVLGGIWFTTFRTKPRINVSEVENTIKKDFIIGSRKGEIVAILEARGIEHSDIMMQCGPPSPDCKLPRFLGATIPLESGRNYYKIISIYFFFDQEEKMRDYRVREMTIIE